MLSPKSLGVHASALSLLGGVPESCSTPSTAAAVDKTGLLTQERLDYITRTCPGANGRFLMPAALLFMKPNHISLVEHRKILPTHPRRSIHQASHQRTPSVTIVATSGLASGPIHFLNPFLSTRRASQGHRDISRSTQDAQPRRDWRIF